jgi:arabinofuranan 3-O-arabinosyltransferase
LLQTPGLATFDTKLDLVVDPGAFLERSLSIWSPDAALGEMQNQAYGYLFPLGPVFWLADAVGLPAWLTLRLWSAAVMILGCEGARRVARAWGGLGWDLALLAGVAYVIAPRFLTIIGVLTGEVLAAAVLPWAVLPLVLARRGRMSPGSAVVLSACAVLLMGGQNAVVTLSTLPMPAVVVIAGVLSGDLPRRCLLSWPVLVLAACAWWLGPLLVLGRYSAPFLDFIESASNTTGPLGWFNSVRGADHWVAYILVGGEPWWQAGYALARDDGLVVLTAVVASLGLAGLLQRSTPDRAVLLFPAGLGLVCLVAAHGTWAGGLFDEQLRALLDGALAPLRNVHKVDPLVRLPLALGLAYFVRDLVPVTGRLLARLPRSTRVTESVVLPILVGGLLAAAAQPALAGNLRMEPGWNEIPSAWQDAAAAVDDLPAGSRMLLAPGSGFGLQVWGRTVDEPIQPLTTTPWVVRGQAPLVPGATIRYLDAVEMRLAAGRGSRGLAPALRRAGITHVLLRTDLDQTATETPDPRVVRDSLSLSPGVVPIASFGIPEGAAEPLELWQVRDSQAADPRVRAVELSGAVSVGGGPENVVTMLEQRLLGPSTPTIIDSRPGPTDQVAVATDGLQRRERAFGRVHDAVSSLMSRDDPFRTDRPTHDFPAGDDDDATAAWYPGMASVAASSSAGYADSLGPIDPASGPYSALDGDLSTAWRSAPLTDPLGQEVRVAFAEPQPLGRTTISVDGGPGRATVTAVRVTTDQGSVTARVPVSTGRVDVDLPAGPTATVRIGIAGVEDQADGSQVGIREIELPGVDATRTATVPWPVAADTSVLLATQPETRACHGVVPTCSPGRLRAAEEAVALDRVLEVEAGARWTFEGEVVARPSPASIGLLAPLPAPFIVRGSSVLGSDPAVAPVFALDEDPATTWVTDPGDRRPTLSLDWRRPRLIRGVTITRPDVPDDALPDDVAFPETMTITAGKQHREMSVGDGGRLLFEAIATRSVTIEFGLGNDGEAAQRPMVIGDLSLVGHPGLRSHPDPTRQTGDLCGLGPPVQVDGRTFDTRVSGSVQDLLVGTPLDLELCRADAIPLDPGLHRIRILSTARFQPVRAALEPVAAETVTPAERAVRVLDWGTTDRTVAVASGPESLLWVRENTNEGWRATYDGEPLEPLVVDGWAQGWVVPAGAGGEVRLEYAPQSTYSTLLLVGAALAALLAVGGVAAWFARTRVHRGSSRPSAFPGGVIRVLAWEGIAFAAVFGGVGIIVGAIAPLLPGLRGERTAQVGVVAAMLVAAVLAVATDGTSVTADFVAAVAVGLALSPRFTFSGGVTRG